MLHKIVEVKKQELIEIRESFTYAAAEKVISNLPGCTSMKKRFQNRSRSIGVISEVKKASLLKG